MSTRAVPDPVKWRNLYQAAMLESDKSKLPTLLDNAINAVLDRLEDAFIEINGELEELNDALNKLRSRRRDATSFKSGCGSVDQATAA
jgi:hypothetical protein